MGQPPHTCSCWTEGWVGWETHLQLVSEVGGSSVGLSSLNSWDLKLVPLIWTSSWYQRTGILVIDKEENHRLYYVSLSPIFNFQHLVIE